MALILDSLYDALKSAGASEEQARTAARDVAAYDNRLNRIERDLTLVKWMVGAVIAVQLGTFWMQWQVVDDLAGIEARITAIAPSAAGMRSSLADD
jgi:ribosomal protein S19